MFFRRKQTLVEGITAADAIEGFKNAPSTLPDWLNEAYEAGRILVTNETVQIHTPSGWTSAHKRDGDYILCGPIAGDVYPCKAKAFAANYLPEPLDKDGMPLTINQSPT